MIVVDFFDTNNVTPQVVDVHYIDEDSFFSNELDMCNGEDLSEYNDYNGPRVSWLYFTINYKSPNNYSRYERAFIEFIIPANGRWFA